LGRFFGQKSKICCQKSTQSKIFGQKSTESFLPNIQQQKENGKLNILETIAVTAELKTPKQTRISIAKKIIKL
jgi:Zn-dependent alcohol dehydrogenase